MWLALWTKGWFWRPNLPAPQMDLISFAFLACETKWQTVGFDNGCRCNRIDRIWTWERFAWDPELVERYRFQVHPHRLTSILERHRKPKWLQPLSQVLNILGTNKQGFDSCPRASHKFLRSQLNDKWLYSDNFLSKVRRKRKHVMTYHRTWPYFQMYRLCKFRLRLKNGDNILAVHFHFAAPIGDFLFNSLPLFLLPFNYFRFLVVVAVVFVATIVVVIAIDIAIPECRSTRGRLLRVSDLSERSSKHVGVRNITATTKSTWGGNPSLMSGP